MRHDPTFWLLARASGMTAYALLTLSVLAGLVLKARPFAGLKPARVTGIHRTVALSAIGALIGHGAALVLDATARVSPLGLVVPGLAGHRPLATSLGVLAGELMVIVYVSYFLRRRIGARAWRRLHWMTYAVFAAATVHGLAAGTDTPRPFALALYLGSLGAVGAATAYRALVPAPLPRRPLTPRLKGEAT
jgi:sulfoxide reductase heme-binding subunit YedZ